MPLAAIPAQPTPEGATRGPTFREQATLSILVGLAANPENWDESPARVALRALDLTAALLLGLAKPEQLQTQAKEEEGLVDSLHPDGTPWRPSDRVSVAPLVVMAESHQPLQRQG